MEYCVKKELTWWHRNCGSGQPIQLEALDTRGSPPQILSKGPETRDQTSQRPRIEPNRLAKKIILMILCYAQEQEPVRMITSEASFVNWWERMCRIPQLNVRMSSVNFVEGRRKREDCRSQNDQSCHKKPHRINKPGLIAAYWNWTKT